MAMSSKCPTLICMHGFGVLWKGTDWRNGQSEVRRSQTFGGFAFGAPLPTEYGFFWYFCLVTATSNLKSADRHQHGRQTSQAETYMAIVTPGALCASSAFLQRADGYEHRRSQ